MRWSGWRVGALIHCAVVTVAATSGPVVCFNSPSVDAAAASSALRTALQQNSLLTVLSASDVSASDSLCTVSVSVFTDPRAGDSRCPPPVTFKAQQTPLLLPVTHVLLRPDAVLERLWSVVGLALPVPLPVRLSLAAAVVSLTPPPTWEDVADVQDVRAVERRPECSPYIPEPAAPHLLLAVKSLPSSFARRAAVRSALAALADGLPRSADGRPTVHLAFVVPVAGCDPATLDNVKQQARARALSETVVYLQAGDDDVMAAALGQLLGQDEAFATHPLQVLFTDDDMVPLPAVQSALGFVHLDFACDVCRVPVPGPVSPNTAASNAWVVSHRVVQRLVQRPTSSTPSTAVVSAALAAATSGAVTASVAGRILRRTAWPTPLTSAEGQLLMTPPPSADVTALVAVAPPLSDVTIVVKTFGRPEQLRQCLRSFAAAMPSSPIIVVDDGKSSAEFVSAAFTQVVQHIRLPYDTGLSAGRNAGVAAVTTPFVFVVDDDMAAPAGTALALGVARALAVLTKAGADIVGAQVANDAANYVAYRCVCVCVCMCVRVRVFVCLCCVLECECVPFHRRLLHQLSSRRPCSGTMHVIDGAVFLDHSAHGASFGCLHVDVVPNVLLARASALARVQWDERLKLAEHQDFFLRAKAANLTTLYCGESLQVNHQQGRRKSAEYKALRQREVLFASQWLHRAGFSRLVGPSRCCLLCVCAFCVRFAHYICVTPLPADFLGAQTAAAPAFAAQSPDVAPHVLLMVQSGPRNAARRRSLRNHMSVGWFEHPDWLPLFFVGVDGDPTVHAAVRREAALHGDIVVLDHAESYFALTQKTVAATAWGVRHTASPVLVKVDDDMSVDTAALVRHLRHGGWSTNRNSNGAARFQVLPVTNLYAGHSNGPFVPYRPDDASVGAFERKWVVSRAEYDARDWGADSVDGPGPEYASGGMYMLSRDVAERLLAFTAQRPDNGNIIKFEDVNVGLLMHLLDVPLVDWQDTWRYPHQCTPGHTVAMHFGQQQHQQHQQHQHRPQRPHDGLATALSNIVAATRWPSRRHSILCRGVELQTPQLAAGDMLEFTFTSGNASNVDLLSAAGDVLLRVGVHASGGTVRAAGWRQLDGSVEWQDSAMTPDAPVRRCQDAAGAVVNVTCGVGAFSFALGCVGDDPSDTAVRTLPALPFLLPLSHISKWKMDAQVRWYPGPNATAVGPSAVQAPGNGTGSHVNVTAARSGGIIHDRTQPAARGVVLNFTGSSNATQPSKLVTKPDFNAKLSPPQTASATPGRAPQTPPPPRLPLLPPLTPSPSPSPSPSLPPPLPPPGASHASECLTRGVWKSAPLRQPAAGYAFCRVDERQDCRRRPHHLSWEWIPDDPTCVPTDTRPVSFLHRHAGQHIAFVGDSLARNLFESLLCLVSGAPDVVHVTRMPLPRHKPRHRKTFDVKGVSDDQRVRLTYVPSHFLAAATHMPGSDPEYVLGDPSAVATASWTHVLQEVDTIVLHVGGWFPRDPLFMANETVLDTALAGALAHVRLVAGFTGRVVVVTPSPSHWDGPDGVCGASTPLQLPDLNAHTRRVHNGVVRGLKAAAAGGVADVEVVDISTVAGTRGDAHPENLVTRPDGTWATDCQHHCLPGVPDTINEVMWWGADTPAVAGASAVRPRRQGHGQQPRQPLSASATAPSVTSFVPPGHAAGPHPSPWPLGIGCLVAAAFVAAAFRKRRQQRCSGSGSSCRSAHTPPPTPTCANTAKTNEF